VSKIRVLDEHTINKIAAGEVIENPASVVKELADNALDAGATEIIIEISGGGRSLIRISDNGCGMDADDALLCLERHATSKIRAVEQIETLHTMGFRGEAMPSIACISKFSLITSTASEEKSFSSAAPPMGTMVLVEGGKIISCAPVVRSRGTTIEVKSLFFNLPVRKKFLKSPASDANEILKMVSLLSLASPEVKFQLIVDNKPVFLHKNAESLDQRIGAVLGQEFLQNSAAIEKESEMIKIQGRLGLPCQSRHNRTGQYLFINRRPVVSSLIAYAVKQGYGSALPDSRYPAFVLHLSIPGNMVDVNVHPQKKEVRLRQEAQIREWVSSSVLAALLPKERAIGFGERSGQQWAPPVHAPHFFSAYQASIAVPDCSKQDPNPATAAVGIISSSGHGFGEIKPAEASDYKSRLEPARQIMRSALTPLPPKVLAALPRYIILDSAPNQFLDAAFPVLNRGGLFLMDQKAAHARVIFDQLAAASKGASAVAQQLLLIPYQMELAPHEAEALRTAIPALQQRGLHIQQVGTAAFMIDSIPQIFGNCQLEELFKEIFADAADALSALDMPQRIEREMDVKLAMSASRAAAAHALSLMEAENLVRRLILSPEPYLCPLGKKILCYLSPDELAKQFQRKA
jgi:DNA mismatch repair protein MutL